jgi:hypothetical protein
MTELAVDRDHDLLEAILLSDRTPPDLPVDTNSILCFSRCNIPQFIMRRYGAGH